MAIYSLEIYDEGQSLGFWKKIGIDTPAYVGDGLIRVVSVADMVTKVLNVIGNQKERVELYFKGIGSVNYQSVGAGAIQDYSKDRSLQVDGAGGLNYPGKIWLPRLVGRISRIYLLGVDNKATLYSVSNNASNPLLFALAKIFVGSIISDGDGNHIINYGKSEKQSPTLRTDAERQRLRDSLKKLDRK